MRIYVGPTPPPLTRTVTKCERMRGHRVHAHMRTFKHTHTHTHTHTQAETQEEQEEEEEEMSLEQMTIDMQADQR
jgi:hypothetical protein